MTMDSKHGNAMENYDFGTEFHQPCRSKKPRKFLTWLLDVLDSEKYKEHGTQWIDKEEGVFRCQWPCHYPGRLNVEKSEIFLDFQRTINPKDQKLLETNLPALKEKFRSCIRKYRSIGLDIVGADKKGESRMYKFYWGIPTIKDDDLFMRQCTKKAALPAKRKQNFKTQTRKRRKTAPIPVTPREIEIESSSYDKDFEEYSSTRAELDLSAFMHSLGLQRVKHEDVPHQDEFAFQDSHTAFEGSDVTKHGRLLLHGNTVLESPLWDYDANPMPTTAGFVRII